MASTKILEEAHQNELNLGSNFVKRNEWAYASGVKVRIG
jgi:hypothetical protein